MKPLNLTACTLITLVSMGSLSAMDVLYMETFHYGDSASSADAGWAGGYGGDNGDTTLREANWYEASPGKREIAVGVNSHQLGIHTSPGVIVQSTDPAWVQFYTTEYSVGTDFSELGRIEFDVLNDQRTRDYHLTVQAGGQWYISSESIQTAGFGAQWYAQQGLDLPGLSWYEAPAGFAGVARDPALPDFNAQAAASPGGTVTGFGFVYHMFGTGNVVVDNYTVYAVPEASTVGLLLGLGALGFVVLRRRR